MNIEKNKENNIEKVSKVRENYRVDCQLKVDFVNDMSLVSSESMMNQINNVLGKVDIYESIIGVPVYLYTIEMYKDILGYFRASSVSTLNTYFSIIKKYIEFAIDKRDNVNLDYRLITSKEMESLVNMVAHETRYLTRSELFEVVARAINPQDMAIFVLLYEGIKGKNYEDLTNLKTKDIDFESGIVRLKDREIKIEDKLSLQIIKEATLQTEYTRCVYETGVMNNYPIHPNNEYVIKRIVYNKSDGIEPMKSQRLKIRISELARDMGREYLTGTTVYNSGLAERFLKAFNRHPSDVSDKEIKEFLKINKEKIPCASLRRVAQYVIS